MSSISSRRNTNFRNGGGSTNGNTFSNNNDDDLFDAIVFRDTAGAPKSFTSYASMQSNQRSSIGIATAPTSPTHNAALLESLKPRVSVKLFIHEEVSSSQDKKSAMDEISSHVLLDGAVYAQVKSSLPSKGPRTPRLSSSNNRINHPPFSIRIIDPDYPDDTNFQFDKNFMTLYGASGDGAAQWNTLTVPRAVREQFKVASYHRSVTKKFMPILVQTKVVRCSSSSAKSSNKDLKKSKKRGNKKGNFRNEDGNQNMDLCKVVVQIRSNLNNIGTLKDINIALAIPPTVLGKTLNITKGEEAESGNGRYDELKRVVRWTLPELSRGSTVAFGVEVMVAKSPNVYVGEDDLPRFPILLRCSSIQDTVSSIQVDCRELKKNANVDKITGLGANPTVADDLNSSMIIDVVTQRSFKLLHRLPP